MKNVNGFMVCSLVALSLSLAACCGGTGDTGPRGLQGADGTVVSVQPDPGSVQDLINEANALRDAQGQSQLRNGLTCSLYTVPTSTTAIVGATLTGIGSWSYTGTFNVANGPVTNGLNVMPSALQAVYQTWYVVKCSGVLVNTTNGWHSFSMTSDDGANLYVDGLLINNDGLHATSTKSATRFLSQGIHSFEVDYLQGGGMESLIVQEDGAVIPSANMYH